MLNHSRPHIRKRAVLALYKAIIRYPEVLPQCMTRLREKLDDSDDGMYIWPISIHVHVLTLCLGVVAATVNVLCELVHQNPRDYLPLAPQLFHLLTTSSNNWMLIKIIKLVRHAPLLRGSAFT